MDKNKVTVRIMSQHYTSKIAKAFIAEKVHSEVTALANEIENIVIALNNDRRDKNQSYFIHQEDVKKLNEA